MGGRHHSQVAVRKKPQNPSVCTRDTGHRSHGRATVPLVPDATKDEAEILDPALCDEELEEEEDDSEPSELFKGPLREDPWGRWEAGKEPIRELEVHAVRANPSGDIILPTATVVVEPGVLPTTRFDRKDQDVWDLNFRGRWNAVWTGNRLTQLSLDCFSNEWDEVVRVTLDPDEPVDLLAAYFASSPGFWGLHLEAEDIKTRNARDEIYGHRVSVRDPRLTLQIAARYPGVCPHTAYFELEYQRPTKATGEKALEIQKSLTLAAKSVDGEPMPGLRRAMDQAEPFAGVAAMMGEDAEPPFVPFVESVAATLDSYSAIGTCIYEDLPDATLVEVPLQTVDALSAHVTFPDAISAIRRIDQDRLPLWLDFTADSGEPQSRTHLGGLRQPLYGVFICCADDPKDGEPCHIIVPVGRTVGLDQEPMPLCALAVGPDDSWRVPTPEKSISLITAHRGGVAVNYADTNGTSFGIDPEITSAEIGREISGHIAHTTEWVLARVGAVMSAIEDDLLLLKRLPEGQRSFGLIAVKRESKRRQVSSLDAPTIVKRLRELGSLRRVAEAEDLEIVSVREALDKAGVDPDQVRRDEVLQRYRRSPSIEAVVGELHLFRDEAERFLREAGIDLDDMSIPHDVTDPKILEAIAAYKEEGTLEGAGARLGVSGETVRRRLSQAGLSADQISTEIRRQVIAESVAAWKNAGHNLAGAARALGLDPRTVKAHLLEAGVSVAAASSERDRVAEARQLHEIVGSARAVGALMGLSVSTVRRYLSDKENGHSRGRPRISDEALDQAELAYREHGSIRAAARATGISPGGFSYRLRQARERKETS